MDSNDTLKFTPEIVYYPLLMVFSLWVVFWAETRFGFRATTYGIYPLKIEGLKGIILAPFIHSNLEHLFNNSVPLLVLTMTLFYFYRSIRWRILLMGLLFTGIATWLFARPAWHIGASGVIYMLASFLFFKGVFSKRYQLIALSLMVVFLYGGMLWYLFPLDSKISWEGHLSGFVVGLVFSLLFRKNPVENKKYEWEKASFDPESDPFLKHFDEDGNFIETPAQDSGDEIQRRRSNQIKVVYQYRSFQEEE